MEEIRIDTWPGTYYYERAEVSRAESGGRVLHCLRDAKGNRPYSLIRCNAFAETPEGREVVARMRGRDESGRDQRAGARKGRPAQKR